MAGNLWDGPESCAGLILVTGLMQHMGTLFFTPGSCEMAMQKRCSQHLQIAIQLSCLQATNIAIQVLFPASANSNSILLLASYEYSYPSAIPNICK
jgi:hypothetical protein